MTNDSVRSQCRRTQEKIPFMGRRTSGLISPQSIASRHRSGVSSTQADQELLKRVRQEEVGKRIRVSTNASLTNEWHSNCAQSNSRLLFSHATPTQTRKTLTDRLHFLRCSQIDSIVHMQSNDRMCEWEGDRNRRATVSLCI